MKAVKNILNPVATLFGLGSTPEMPAAAVAAATKPAVMPLPDGDEVKKAMRKRIAEQAGRSGRASTILSDDTKLGG